MAARLDTDGHFNILIELERNPIILYRPDNHRI